MSAWAGAGAFLGVGWGVFRDYPFTLWSSLTAVLVGVLCAYLGVYLVLRRWSLLGDVLGHAALPGIAALWWGAGALAWWWYLPAAWVSALAAVVVLAWMSRRAKDRADASMAIVLAGSFGLGAVLWSRGQRAGHGPSAVQDMLFGNAAAVTEAQAWGTLGMVMVCIAAVALCHRPLALALFDPSYARVIGLPVQRLEGLLLLVVALAVVVSLPMVGVVLVAAMLVLPAQAALLLRWRWRATLVASVALGALAALAGAWASIRWAGVATGPAMVIAASVLFAGLWWWTGRTSRGGSSPVPVQGQEPSHVG